MWEVIFSGVGFFIESRYFSGKMEYRFINDGYILPVSSDEVVNILTQNKR